MQFVKANPNAASAPADQFAASESDLRTSSPDRFSVNPDSATSSGPNGDQSDSPDLGSITPRRTLRRSQHPVVGVLLSAFAHMLLLIVAGLIFATVQEHGTVELRLSVANTNASENLEELSIEVTTSANEAFVATPTSASVVDTEMRIAEPTLFMDSGVLAAGHDDFDAMVKLSDAGNTTQEQPNEAGEASDEKGSFFGADAYGDEFVYLVDMSTSMGARSQYGQTRFRIACRELLRSIRELTPNQKFCVFMFGYRTRVMFDVSPRMMPATTANKQRISAWINGLKLAAGTDPRYGAMTALRLKPDAIFLLSDGEFNGQDVNTHDIPGNPPFEQLIAKQRQDKVPIHTIAFEDMLNRKRLRRIAIATDGTHRFVGQTSAQALLIDDLRSTHPADVAFGLRSILTGTQSIHGTRQMHSITKLIANQLASKNSKVRKLAYETLLFLSDGEDMGPGENASHREYAQARKKWLAFWGSYFKRKRAEANEPTEA